MAAQNVQHIFKLLETFLRQLRRDAQRRTKGRSAAQRENTDPPHFKRPDFIQAERDESGTSACMNAARDASRCGPRISLIFLDICKSHFLAKWVFPCNARHLPKNARKLSASRRKRRQAAEAGVSENDAPGGARVRKTEGSMSQEAAEICSVTA